VDLPDLVSDHVLERLDVVANSTMNRQRRLGGVNSYEKELGFHPVGLLLSRLDDAKPEEAAWLDVCCGTGLAVLQGAHELASRPGGRARIVGIDLVDMFDPGVAGVDGLDVFCTSVADWQPDTTFSLITCVHGLHYLGDKLGALARLAGWLEDDGLLVASFDPGSVRFVGRAGDRSVRAALRSEGFELDSRHHRISLRGGRQVRLPYRYLGADPDAGPNYTGQPAVHSYYEIAG
jgi:trans-aconitate methyltransferase